MIGTEHIDTKRAWSTPSSQRKRASARTSATTTGVRSAAAHPVTPSPMLRRTRPTPCWDRPLVAESTSDDPSGESR